MLDSSADVRGAVGQSSGQPGAHQVDEVVVVKALLRLVGAARDGSREALQGIPAATAGAA